MKVDGSQAITMNVVLSDKASDIVKKIPYGACCSTRDVYVMFEGGVLRRREELRSCGVCDGSAVKVMSRMCGRRRHKDEKEQSGEETNRGTE